MHGENSARSKSAVRWAWLLCGLGGVTASKTLKTLCSKVEENQKCRAMFLSREDADQLVHIFVGGTIALNGRHLYLMGGAMVAEQSKICEQN